MGNTTFSDLALSTLLVAVGCTSVTAEPPLGDPGADGAPSCTAECSPETSCCGSSCSTDSSCSLFLTESSRYAGYVGGGNYVTLTGGGLSPDLEVYIGDGRAPVRWISDTEAMLVTPPAVEGSYDIIVDSGGQRVTLATPFTYHKYGFTDQWVRVDMSTSRGNYPAMATLQDGRVLILGGTVSGDQATALSSAEIFDPTTGLVTPVGSMSVPRFTASAITLLDGRVLVVGACNTLTCPQASNLAVAEVFDPATNTFSTLGNRLVDATRIYLKPVMLGDGRVLIQSKDSASAEIFDPATNTFQLLSMVSSFGALGRPARLRDGRVVFLSQSGVDVYDPALNAITQSIPSTLISAGLQKVHTIPDGRVLSSGGRVIDGPNFVPRQDIAVFDPTTMEIAALPQQLTTPRMSFASSLLRDGSIMVATGVNQPYPTNYSCINNSFSTTSSVDVVDATLGTVTPFAPLPDPMMGAIATTLRDGSIVVAGGGPCGGEPAYPYLYYLESVSTPID